MVQHTLIIQIYQQLYQPLPLASMASFMNTLTSSYPVFTVLQNNHAVHFLNTSNREAAFTEKWRWTNLAASCSHSPLETSFSCRTAERCGQLVMIQFPPDEHLQTRGYPFPSAGHGSLLQTSAFVVSVLLSLPLLPIWAKRHAPKINPPNLKKKGALCFFKYIARMHASLFRQTHL